MREEKQESCSQKDIAIKTIFLGPQAENISHAAEVFAHILHRWGQYRRSRFPADGMSISFMDQTSVEFQKLQNASFQELNELMSLFEDEIPKFSPRYFGHMFSEISLPALYASILALIHNPNNISEEASRVGLKIEAEAISDLGKMIGYSEECTGHFTSCGSIANLEAALRARFHSKASQNFTVFFPKHAHYSWEKIARILGLSPKQIYWIDLNKEGRMDPHDLELKLKQADEAGSRFAFLVSVIGTTEFGICDPLADILEVCRRSHIKTWLHIDAAYGGFFACLKDSKTSSLNKDVQANFRLLAEADSITIDPHKLGYVPYASGSFLCKNKELYQMHSINSPYLHNSGALWTVEGSRSAQGPLSVFLTSKLLPFTEEGFGRILKRHLQARYRLAERLKSISHLHILPAGDLNILSFVIAKTNENCSEVSKRSLALFKNFSPENPNAPYFVTKTQMDPERYSKLLGEYAKGWNAEIDSPLVVIRLCLMNPFFTSKEPMVDYIEDFASQLEKTC